MADNTAQSFKDKWEKNPSLIFSQTLDERSDIYQWILGRNGFGSGADLAEYLKGKRRILDAGCGNGRVTALLQAHCAADRTEIVGIDLVAAEVARANLAQLPNVTIRQKDLLEDLSDLGRFDFVYCQEVLHHTADPKRAFANLCGLLEPGGDIAIYVYKKKAPVREYVDDYIRERIAGMKYEDAVEVCNQITAFGRALAEKNVTVKIPAVDMLEIPAGEYTVQRLLYHFFLKCFWNEELSFGDNAVVNYDWYHPQLCSRHTVEEVRTWFTDTGLKIVHEHVDFYGITVRGRRA